LFEFFSLSLLPHFSLIFFFYSLCVFAVYKFLYINKGLRDYLHLRKIFLHIEDSVNRYLSPRYNPFYYLGAIATILFTILFISGIYLFIFYRTGNPYGTVQYLTEDQWYAGGIMRSIHRYASDGLIIFLLLHTIREYLNGRYRHYRWLAWITGIALFLIILILGVTGYWLVWDERGQIVALKTMEMLSDIPLFVEPLSMALLSNETFSQMLFFLLHFLHIALPIATIILIGIHIMRCSRPVITPPKIITISIIAALLVMSIIKPAASVRPADLTVLPVDAPFDWFYLFIYPIKSILPKSVFWLITAGGTLLLLAMPWIKRRRPIPVQVVKENCTGCDQCNKDCPYGAVYMQPRDEYPYKMEAVIKPERCSACGICIGSCDFNALNLPAMTDAMIKDKIDRLLSSIPEGSKSPRILGLTCEHSIRLDKDMPNVKTIYFPCIGMVHPSIIEYSLNSGADGIFICGCANGDCHYREGNTWLQSRLDGKRAPALSRTVDRKRIREYWLSSIHTDRLMEEIRLFERKLMDYPLTHPSPIRVEGKKEIFKRGAVFSSIILLSAASILYLSEGPIYPFYNKEMALIKFAFKYSGRHKSEQRELTEKETENMLRHMRRTNSPFPKMRMVGKRERLPVYIELEIDNRMILSKTYYPAGLKNDGPTFAYEEIPVLPGAHHIKIRMRDSKRESGFDYIFEKEIEAQAGKVIVVSL
jgi:quinol-cytochrome oxidoreductase complex cytochrome b subunit/coenzyme F420-reducing hydrogenase delta subunit/Pyruvate/2-oxoacid:ferredoxin oxidoreductase delta subunit